MSISKRHDTLWKYSLIKIHPSTGSTTLIMCKVPPPLYIRYIQISVYSCTNVFEHQCKYIQRQPHSSWLRLTYTVCNGQLDFLVMHYLNDNNIMFVLQHILDFYIIVKWVVLLVRVLFPDADYLGSLCLVMWSAYIAQNHFAIANSSIGPTLIDTAL